jgi:CRISPR-associated protein Cas5h
MGYPDRLILFDLAGSMGHFRKFYTNSSSLSYSFPSRTTVCGLIAGLLGKPRDSYYEEFSLAQCRIGLSLRKPIRKIIQTVNYVRTKRLSEVDASAGHTQVPLELVLPLSTNQKLTYRIYFWHEDDDLMEELWRRLWKRRFIYPPYLGITECPAEIRWVSLVDGGKLNWLSEPEEPLEIITVIPVERIQPEGLRLKEGLQLLKDRQPLALDSYRLLTSVADILYERNTKPIELVPKGDVFHLAYEDQDGPRKEYGVFMEM